MLMNIKAITNRAFAWGKRSFPLFRDFYWDNVLPFIGRVHLDVGSGGLSPDGFVVKDNQFVRIPPGNKKVVLLDPAYSFITHVPFNEKETTRFQTIERLEQSSHAYFDSISFINSCHHLGTMDRLLRTKPGRIARSLGDAQYILIIARQLSGYISRLRPGGQLFIYEYSLQPSVTPADLVADREQREIREEFNGNIAAFYRYHNVLKLGHFLSALWLNKMSIEAFDQDDKYCWIRAKKAVRSPWNMLSRKCAGEKILP